MESLIVSKDNLKHNIEVVKNYVYEHRINNTPRIIGVVKGNGYGLGLIELSNFLIDNGIDMLAVSKVDEAVKLRENNIMCDILLLSSTTIQQDARKIIGNDIIPTIGSLESLRVYEKVAKEMNQVIDAHIGVETGFSRYGVSLENMDEFINEYMKCENIKFVGAFTHYISAFDKSCELVDKQYHIFEKAINRLKEKGIDGLMLHICNSSATFKYPKYYLDAVRVGSAFAGKLPFDNNYGLIKLGYIQTQIAETKHIKAGDVVDYGGIYKAKKDMTLGVLQIGYTSGVNLQFKSNVVTIRSILRDIKNLFINYNKQATVVIKGKTYNIVSNVKMNNIMIDITGSDVQIGDVVQIQVIPTLVDSGVERKYV